MRRLLLIAMVLLLLASLSRGEETTTAAAATPSEKPVRLAIIAGQGERAPDAATFALVEKNLLEMPDVAWIERERVAIALKELALAATLDVSQRTLKLGRVLPADLFVFVESVSGSQPRLHCVSVVETRTGIVLSSWIGEQQDAQQPAALQVVVGQATAKARVPVGKRRAFSLLGCHSDEPSRTLDPLAQTLGQLLMHDLGEQNDCVVLDREHCRRIREEEALATVRLELANSLFLLECGIRQGDKPGQIAVTVIIRSLQGAESGRVAVVLPANDLAAARHILVAAVTGSVGASAPPQTAISAQAEALAFQRMAQALLSHDAGEEAARAAEVAYALAPSTDAAEMLAGAYGKWAYNLRATSPTTAEKKQMLTVQIRERELEYTVMQQRLEGSDTNNATRPFLRRMTDSAGAEQRLSLNAGEEGLRDLLVEKTAWERRINQYAIDHSIPGSWAYFGELDKIIRYGQHWTQTPQAFEDLYRQAFRCYLTAPVYAAAPGARLNFLHGVNFDLAPNSFGVTGTEYRQAAARVFQWAADEGAAQSDFPLQACSLTALAQVSDDSAAACDAATRALDLFVHKVPIEHPDRNGARFHTDDQWTAMLVFCAMEKLTNRTDRLLFLEQILTPVIDSGDAGRLQAWWSRITEWINTLTQMNRTREALAICERAVQQMNARVPPDVTSGGSYDMIFRNHRDQLVRLAADLRLKAGVTSDKDGSPLVPVDIGGAPAGMSALMAMVRKGDDLVLVWTGVASTSGTPLSVTRVRATGGAQTSLGQMTVPLKDAPVSAVEMNGQDLYVGLRSGGLLVLGANGSAHFWSETNGLPGNSVRALACARGRIILSVSQNAELKAWWRSGPDYTSGALYEFDPGEQKFVQLASSRSAEGRHELDGGGAYSIEALIPDDQRRCLWMGINGANRSGIWRYSLADGTFVRVPAVIPPLLQGLHADGGMIFGVTHDSIFEFDPEQSKIRVIDQGTTAYRWPCVRVAGSFVSIHYRDLRLESLDGTPTPVINRSVKGTTGFELRPAHLVSWSEREFLIGSEDGRIWRVTL